MKEELEQKFAGSHEERHDQTTLAVVRKLIISMQYEILQMSCDVCAESLYEKAKSTADKGGVRTAVLRSTVQKVRLVATRLHTS